MPLAKCVLLAALAVASSQQPAQQQPLVFGVGVDVVAVDASVVEKDGKPVLGLTLDDFRVEVDGNPRRLVSVEYVGRDLEPAAAPAPGAAHFSSNEDAPRGRLILMLVDRGNIGQGGGREVLKAADRFLSNLAPADRVGLSFIPGPGASIEFSGDHDAVRRGLRGVVGTASRGGYEVPLAEALAYLKGMDQMRWEQFARLTCDSYKIAEQMEACRRKLENDAAEVYHNYRERSLATQRSLAMVFRTLKGVEGPKTVILVSEGLGTESEPEVRDLATAASEAQVTLYVVLLNTGSLADASYSRSALARSEDRELETGGLHSLAGHSRGLVLNAVASGDSAFQRLSRELMGYYLLGFEPESGDRDGKAHAVKVLVGSRPGATVRARGLLSIPTVPPSHEAMLISALRSPLVDRGLPLRATAYALHDVDPGKVRLLIAAHVGRASRPLSVGFSVSDAAGKVVASRAYQGIASGEGDWVEFTGEAVVDPSAYTLRVAAVDAAGRHGSVEHPVKAAPVSASGLEVSDLVLGATSTGGAVGAGVELELAGGGMTALLDVGGRDEARVGRASVALELADTAEGPALLRVPVTLGAPGKGGAREASVAIAAGLLPPGAYVARAEVSLDGKPVSAVLRPFRIAAARGGSQASSPLASLLSDPRPFDKAELLAPEPLRHFADRVFAAVGGPVPAPLAAALAEARGGRAAAILDQLGDGGREDARAAFLRGVSLYARGQAAAALTQLQSALRQSSDLFPAAVYMGACYAALGKDLEAIGAWQTALVGEGGGSAVLYALLTDALTRVKEPQQAIDILDEGLGAFPQDAGLRRRLALAHASAGHRDEALPLLTAWVEAHPDDNEALLATLAVLFDGFARQASGAGPGEQGGGAGEERAQLVRFARAYVAGNGPNREVIGRWLRYLTSEAGS